MRVVSFAVLLIAVSVALFPDEVTSLVTNVLKDDPAPISPTEQSEDSEACLHIRTNLKPAMIFVLILLVFSFLVESLLHHMEHWLKHREQLLKIVRTIYNELMLLGMIGIFIFFLNRSQLTGLLTKQMAKWGTQDPGDLSKVIPCKPEQLVDLFEKVHLGIFANMGIYFITCGWLILLHWLIYQYWIRIDLQPFDYAVYRNLLHDHKSEPWYKRFLNVKRTWQLWRLRAIDRLHALRYSCIEQYGLPEGFQFSWYFKLAMRDVVIQILDVHPLCWAVLIVAFGFTLIRISILRVDNSETTLVIYGSLSLAVSLVCLFILISASRIYGKVLRLGSVRRYLHIQNHAEDSDSSSDPSHAINDETRDEAVPLLTDLTPSLKISRDRHSSMNYASQRNTIEAMAATMTEKSDSLARSFQDVAKGNPLCFNVFQRVGDTLTMMTVDEYRTASKLVGNILARAQIQNSDDSEHKSMLFFRSRKYLIVALQVVTFVQSWLLGLSIYYAWSVYNDVPTDIPAHGGLVTYIAVGPLLTYGLLGLTLEKLVKGTYTGGLIRPELILETLFAPALNSSLDTQFTSLSDETL